MKILWKTIKGHILQQYQKAPDNTCTVNYITWLEKKFGIEHIDVPTNIKEFNIVYQFTKNITKRLPQERGIKKVIYEHVHIFVHLDIHRPRRTNINGTILDVWFVFNEFLPK